MAFAGNVLQKPLSSCAIECPVASWGLLALRLWQALMRMVERSAATGGTCMFATMMKLWNNEDGATAIEYGLIAALIAVAAISAFQLVGTNLSNTFHGIAT